MSRLLNWHVRCADGSYSEIVAPNVDVSKLDALGIIYSAESRFKTHREPR